MKLILATFFVLMAMASSAVAASGKRPAPPDALAGAPAEFTQFTSAELQRGFLALAFGSDLRIGARPLGIRRFVGPVRAQVIAGGSVARAAAAERIVEEYAAKIPNLRLSVVTGATADADTADIEVRLIDESEFEAALRAAFGIRVARDFIRRTNPQCMTSVKSAADGAIVRAVTFVIVDKGEEVFRDCAYHELLHAFGLSNHDQRNPYTTLNQQRMVGYLTVYDQALLTLLYDPRIVPGMTRAQVRKALPGVISSLRLAAPVRGR